MEKHDESKKIRLAKDVVRNLTVKTNIKAGMLKANSPSKSCGQGDDSCTG
ncbi:MAG TPA: hypothetical protein VGI39_43985 [Polyangiaceae bacterium]|jgi:hypothetical protein